MVRVIRGKLRNGEDCSFQIEPMLAQTMDRVIRRVRIKKWDYVSIVAGLPGSGKSTFAQMLARYCSETFDENYVVFSADDFIRVTTECPMFSSIILDESFEALNNKIAYSQDFIRIVNHLQIIRQKRLFIFLCLPNFFDLSKGIAVFRASNLFVTYGDDEDNKGYYLCFGRDGKRKLYVKGLKFMDYTAEKANFHGRFSVPRVIPEEIYENMKREHMISMDQKYSKTSKDKDYVIKFVLYLKNKENWTTKQINEVSSIPESTIRRFIHEHQQKINFEEQKNKKDLKIPIKIRYTEESRARNHLQLLDKTDIKEKLVANEPVIEGNYPIIRRKAQTN